MNDDQTLSLTKTQPIYHVSDRDAAQTPLAIYDEQRDIDGDDD
jgi:hypothetical protein